MFKWDKLTSHFWLIGRSGNLSGNLRHTWNPSSHLVAAGLSSVHGAPIIHVPFDNYLCHIQEMYTLPNINHFYCLHLHMSSSACVCTEDICKQSKEAGWEQNPETTTVISMAGVHLITLLRQCVCQSVCVSLSVYHRHSPTVSTHSLVPCVHTFSIPMKSS